MPSPVAPPLELDRAPGRPPILRVTDPGDPAGWAATHRDALRQAVTGHGAVLVRGLGPRDAGAVAAVAARLGRGLMPEREPFAPRTAHPGGVYSATPWPANQPMCMHHELSYACEFPTVLLFACLVAPAEGGATGVADAASVLAALPRELVQRFERYGWMLTRTYNDEIGASVADAFGTDDRAAVERYCRSNAIEFAWQPDGGLRTRQRRAAVLRHAVTGRPCWFNQIAFLSEWTLEPEVREYLVDVHGPEGLPFTTHYGDGDPIGRDVVDLLNQVYLTHTTREPWQAGDLLLVDNVACAHSREPFSGPREVLAALLDPARLDGGRPTLLDIAGTR